MWDVSERLVLASLDISQFEMRWRENVILNISNYVRDEMRLTELGEDPLLVY